jgi:energy-coupling factor transporter ATP-binding protein EcfA2
MTNYTYSAYGINFSSAIPLPELLPNNNSEPDVKIRLGKVPKQLESPSAYGLLWQAESGKLLLSIDEVARYLILEDREVIIEPYPESSEDKIRSFLLGSILGALLYSRQIPVLHSSVINTDRGAVLFMGRSGAGKSTLLATFLMRGYGMLTDDKAGIMIDEDDLVKVLPAFPAARMMRNTIKHLNFPINGSAITKGKRKCVIRVKNFINNPTKIYAAYFLKPYNEQDIKLEELGKFDKFQLLNQNTYRRKFIQEQVQKRLHLGIVSKLAEQAKVVKVSRPGNSQLINKLADEIEEDFSK